MRFEAGFLFVSNKVLFWQIACTSLLKKMHELHKNGCQLKLAAV